MATPDLKATLRALQDGLRKAQAEEVPDGWLTVKEWAEKAQMSKVQAGRILRNAADAGLVEMRYWRIAVGNRVQEAQHFKTKGKE
jgi:hypothetical protein